MAFTLMGGASYAKSETDLKKDLKEAKQGIQEAKNDYQEKRAKEAAIKKKIVGLEANIKRAEKELKAIEKDISTNNDKIVKITEDVERLEGEVGVQNDDLNSRLRLMYLSGNSSVFEVLLGSENITDFLANLDMIQKIHAQDVAVLDDLNRKLDEVERKKKELEDVKAALTEQEEAQKKKQAQLAADKKELSAAQKQAHADTLKAWDEIEDTQAESARLEKELRNLQSQRTYGGGKMGWPVSGRVTSEYGYRVHPISHKKKMHAGIDISAPTGTPVHAASDGVVISAGWNGGGYGNLVLIDHGSGVVTAYAHNSSISCGPGQSVKRGDVIAKVGSTGYSTGPHCHFEVRVNGAPKNPRGWL
jgi:murein DD-endopeptidase MepM/ murein hydrolase activator NlpD